MDIPPTITIYKREGIKVMLVTAGHTLPEVLEVLELAIKGHGYGFEGSLDFVEEER